MRIPLLASVLIVGGISSVVASGSAEAAVIADPVTAITVSPSNPRINDPVRTDMVWCVPDSATAGDTFEVALPPQLVQLPKSFNLRDPNGILVATALIAGTPAVATFTFNSYVDTHNAVCGTAFFESRLDSSLVPGNSYTLTYVVNHTTTFNPVINVRPGPVGGVRSIARKGGYFADPTDECRTVAEGCLGWYIESQLGPFNSVTVTDTAPSGITFVCNQVSVSLWSVNASGGLVSSTNFASAQVTCSPTQLQVVGSNIPADRLMRVLVRATPAVLDPAGGVTFANSATVTHVSTNSVVVTDNISALRRSSLVGGDANGVVPPTTTTTTSPPAVESPTTTTIVSALPPSPPPTTAPPAGEGPQLPATGSDNTMLLAGLVVFLAGGFAVVIAASRRRKMV